MSSLGLRRAMVASACRTRVAGLLVICAAALLLHHGVPMEMGNGHDGMSDTAKELVVCMAVVGLGAAAVRAIRRSCIRRRVTKRVARWPQLRLIAPSWLAAPARAGPYELQVLRL